MKKLMVFIQCYLSSKTSFVRYANKELTEIGELREVTKFDRFKETVIGKALCVRFTDQEELEELNGKLYHGVQE